MYQSTRRSLKNSQGYTLMEALFQVAVFVLFSHYLILIYFLISQMNNSLLSNEHVAWEVFVQDVQKYFLNIEEITVSKRMDEVEIKQINSTDRRQLDRYGDIIRLQTNNKGYIAMIIGIKDAKFELNESFLTIKVEFQNGLKKERTFFVELYKE